MVGALLLSQCKHTTSIAGRDHGVCRLPKEPKEVPRHWRSYSKRCAIAKSPNCKGLSTALHEHSHLYATQSTRLFPGLLRPYCTSPPRIGTCIAQKSTSYVLGCSWVDEHLIFLAPYQFICLSRRDSRSGCLFVLGTNAHLFSMFLNCK
jgi:hypothetical protein